MRAQPLVNERAELAIVRLERLAGLHLLKQVARPGLGLLPLSVEGFVVPVPFAARVLAHEYADEPLVAPALAVLLLGATVDHLAGAPRLGFVGPRIVVGFVGCHRVASSVRLTAVICDKFHMAFVSLSLHFKLRFLPSLSQIGRITCNTCSLRTLSSPSIFWHA